MQKYVIESENLCKKFHSFEALKSVSIKMEHGKVYGLIGKNGAGKTSFMRIIAGLSYPTSGEYKLFGASDTKGIQEARKKVGCLIEYPSLNGNMTAMENLTMHRIMRGIKTPNIEKEVLQLVGLDNTGKKKTKDFSLGMRQRLGIAVAMLSNPELLILDEPINGLDPIGVVEIRKLIRMLCEERGMTVLISSHNLPELYQTASDYIIIDHGVVKKTMTLAELDEECQHHIVIKTKQQDKLVHVLENVLHTKNYNIADKDTFVINDFEEQEEKVAQALLDNQILATKFCVEGDSLESYFVKIVGGEK